MGPCDDCGLTHEWAGVDASCIAALRAALATEKDRRQADMIDHAMREADVVKQRDAAREEAAGWKAHADAMADAAEYALDKFGGDYAGRLGRLEEAVDTYRAALRPPDPSGGAR